MTSLIKDIESSIRRGVPGADIQFQMASLNRYTRSLPPDHAVHAAVLLLIYPGAGSPDPHMVFIERLPHNLNDHHRGQISFPGGRYEPEDTDLSRTALREAEEEVGVYADSVRLLGRLTELYVPVSGYLIHPFVGYTEQTPDFRPQQTEVNAIIEGRLPDLANANNRLRKDIRTPANTLLRDVPCFMVQGKIIWGATAMILNEFLHLSPFRTGI